MEMEISRGGGGAGGRGGGLLIGDKLKETKFRKRNCKYLVILNMELKNSRIFKINILLTFVYIDIMSLYKDLQ